MEIEQKWGFGMAPIKAEVQAERIRCARIVLEHLASTSPPVSPDLEALSTAKGLFARSHRQDQWDWFTVWRQLGRPGCARAKRIAEGLHAVRRSVTHPSNEDRAEAIMSGLREERAVEHLAAFVSGRMPPREGVGYVYLLSNRENPDLLKIGYTNRDVEERVKEINSATGVLVPYGVRGLWDVRDAASAEAQIHQALAQHRVRRDREFFRVDYRTASRVITDVVRQLRSEG